MKSLILFTFLFLAAAKALDQELIDYFRMIMTKKMEMCAEEVGAGPEDVATLLSKNIPESYEGKCILFCIHKIFHVQNDDGSLNKEGAKAALDILREIDPEMHEKVMQIMITCSTTVLPDPDACLYAAGLGTCVVEEARSMGFDDLFQ